MKITTSHLQKLLQIAATESSTINRQFKHVSIVTNTKGHILSVGTNRLKTHTSMVQLGYPMAQLHSEVDAFTKLTYNEKKKRLILVNFRLNVKDELRLSKPCKYCMPWCISAFEEIFYSTENGFDMLVQKS